MSIEAMKQALEALELARSTHDVMLLSDPPQKAWKYHNVDWKLLGAVNHLGQAIAEAEKQEPVAYMNPDDLCADTAFRWCAIDEFTRPVYTSPPQRQWVGLTDEELDHYREQRWWSAVDMAKEVEAKLKEKNA